MQKQNELKSMENNISLLTKSKIEVQENFNKQLDTIHSMNEKFTKYTDEIDEK